MTKIRTLINRNIKAISPVIATLLIIAITIVASLVAYAWIQGYLNFTTNRIEQGLSIQSISFDSQTGNLLVYVQNTGKGNTQINSNCVYVNGQLKDLLRINGNSNPTYPFSIIQGQTVALAVNYVIDSNQYVTVKVTTSNGFSTQLSHSVSPSTTDKVVYAVVCIDSEFLSPNDHYDYVGTSNPNPTLDMSEYSTTMPMEVAASFDDDFRLSHVDSYGTPLKLTWFAEMDLLMSQGNYVWGDGSPAGVSGYTAIYDILMANWGNKFQLYGDTFAYHHHFLTYDGTWEFPSSDIVSSDSYDYQMRALDHMIIDAGFYPSVWRSGNNLMSPGLSDWLEQWIPFDLTTTVDPGTWYPIRESGNNRWTVSPENPPTQEGVNAAFERAQESGSAIYSIWCHNDNDLQLGFDAMHQYLNAAALNPNYQGVTFRYVSAQEAMQKALRLNDVTKPTLELSSQSGQYTIRSNEPLWANHPYVALKLEDGTYTHIRVTASGTNTWTFTTPISEIVSENVATRARGTDGLSIASATASSSQDYHVPQEAIDGDEMTFWDSYPGVIPQWLQLDLGSSKTFSDIRMHFYDGDDRSYRYKIDVSNDGSTWVNIVPEKTGKSVVYDQFTTVTARYIKITVTANTSNNSAHIIEVNVGGIPPSVTASSSLSAHPAEQAINGIDSAYDYWKSNTQTSLATSPQSLIVDIRTPEVISKIETHFDDLGNRYTYKIESSIDGSSWTTIVQTKTAGGIVKDEFPQITTRFIRITINGNSGGDFAQIQELRIYHQESLPMSAIKVIGLAGSDLSGNTAVKNVNIP
jgi:flagellin-like protein